MGKFLFVQPHPDDLELNCGQILHYLTRKNRNTHTVSIISVTKGEFGLPGSQYDKFKGNFLAKVRTRELENAMAIHGIPSDNIHYLGYIDGYVPFKEEIIGKFVKFLSEYRPDIIFAPEPLYTSYVHIDHVNSGRVIYYILYNQRIEKYKPKLFFYSSLLPNFLFPFTKEDYYITERLLACHKTQFWLLNQMKIINKIKTRWYGMQVRGWKFAEFFRKVDYNKDHLSLKQDKIPLLVRMVYRFCWAHRSWFNAKYPAGSIY